MPAAASSYCSVSDLRKGDIPLPSYVGDGGGFVDAAAEEIDSQLGHIYVTPFTIPATAANRPSILMLKKINWLIASGRLLLDLAAAGENGNLHAYGMKMLVEGLEMLKCLANGDISLIGAAKLDDGAAQKNFTGPAIHNEDGASLVQGFYEGHQQPGGLPLAETWPFNTSPVVPYGTSP